MEADEDLIHQVLYNLTDNAVKFVTEGGYIQFDYSSDSNNVYISVKNSGQGLSKEEITKVFDRFYKSDKSRSLDKNGAGLGLYIVKSIIQAHGERVWAESEPGEFTRFSFTLAKANEKKKNDDKKLIEEV